MVILLGTLTFWIGYKSNIIRETKLVEYVEYVNSVESNSTTETNSSRELSVRKDYPNFNPFVYSLDMFVPLVDLRQAAYWLPSVGKSDEIKKTSESISTGVSKDEDKKEIMITGVGFLRLYMWLHILAGWILTSLLVVGLSGLVKR